MAQIFMVVYALIIFLSLFLVVTNGGMSFFTQISYFPIN
jgi:hypothetical protein